MTLRTFTVFLWGCLIATAAITGEEHRTHIKIAVDGDTADHRVIEIDDETHAKIEMSRSSTAVN